jgi:hypothetical protein
LKQSLQKFAHAASLFLPYVFVKQRSYLRNGTPATTGVVRLIWPPNNLPAEALLLPTAGNHISW